MISVERTIISQYDQSATIVQLVRNMDAYIDPRADIDAFLAYVWDVSTAKGFGLDIWGRIVDIGRDLQVPPSSDYFGFQTGADDWQPFGEAPFYDSSATNTETFSLSDDAYRQLIMVKALANISTTTVPVLNQLLQNLFAGRGRCYVNDLGGMRIRYTFEFLLTEYELAIMTQSGALPRPAGVGSIVFNYDPGVFGFASDDEPFNQAPFVQEVNSYAAI